MPSLSEVFDSSSIGNEIGSSPRQTPSLPPQPLSVTALSESAGKPSLISSRSNHSFNGLPLESAAGLPREGEGRHAAALPTGPLHLMIDQQRCALIEHLTNQHCTQVQFVEKQFELFLLAIKFQSNIKGLSALSPANASLFEEANELPRESNYSNPFHPKATADTTDAKFPVIPSIVEGGQLDDSMLSTVTDTPSAAEREGPEPKTSDPTNQGTASRVFSYFRSRLSDPLAAQSALDAHFKKKKVSKIEMRKARTDLHVEEQLGKVGVFGLRTPQLDFLVAVVICLNGITMALEVEWQGTKSAKTLGIDVHEDSWPNAENFFLILEHVYTAFFILEMMRLYYQSWQYFCERANVFDAFLVFSAVLDTYLLPLLDTEGTDRNLTLLRCFRLFKFARVMRIVRVLKFCSSLRVLVKTVVTGCYSLVWSLVLLGIIICGAGIVAAQLTESSIVDESLPFERRMWIYHYYGTALRSMYTIFEVTLSGCWPNYARRLIHEVSGWWAVFWILYILLVVFAVLRIISAIFLKDTLNNAKADADMMIAEQIKTKERYIEKMRNAFEAIDTKGAGVVSRREFDFVLKHPKVSAYLAVLDLEVHESSLLFNLLDEEGSGCITYEAFLEGVMRLKGQARALDVIAIQQDFKAVWKGLSYISDNFERVFGNSSRNDPAGIAARRLFDRKARGSKRGSLISRCPDDARGDRPSPSKSPNSTPDRQISPVSDSSCGL